MPRGFCIAGQEREGGKNGLSRAWPVCFLCGYRAALISLLAQERPLRDNRKWQRARGHPREPLPCQPTLPCPVPSIVLDTQWHLENVC